jgi:hypothetical protein
MRTATWALAALLGAALTAAQSEPTADEIIRRVAVKSVANGEDRDGLMCTLTQKTYDTGRDPERLKKTEVWDIWYTNGETWKRKISENGVAVQNPEDEKTEPDFTTRLAELFRYELGSSPKARDPISGKECWVIRFAPNPDAEPHGLNEEVSSNLSGVMFIDPDDFWIRFASGNLKKTYRKFLFVGRVHELSFVLQQTDAPGAVMPRIVHVQGRGSILIFKKRNERVERIYSDFRPLEPLTITPTPPQ